MDLHSMKLASFSLLLVGAGCATAPPVVSPAQGQAFAELVRKAEAEGAATEPPEAARLLREAKSEFDYAQRMPKYPARARLVLNKAQADAEMALVLAKRRHDEQTAANLRSRQAKMAMDAADSAAATAALSPNSSTPPTATLSVTAAPSVQPPAFAPRSETGPVTTATGPMAP